MHNSIKKKVVKGRIKRHEKTTTKQAKRSKMKRTTIRKLKQVKQMYTY